MAAAKVNDQVLHKPPEEVVLSLYYLDKGVKMTTMRTKEQLEETEEFLLRKTEDINKSSYPCRGGIFCKTCEYKMICQTFV